MNDFYGYVMETVEDRWLKTGALGIDMFASQQYRLILENFLLKWEGKMQVEIKKYRR